MEKNLFFTKDIDAVFLFFCFLSSSMSVCAKFQLIHFFRVLAKMSELTILQSIYKLLKYLKN